MQVCRVWSLVLWMTRVSHLTCSVRFLGLHGAGVPDRLFPSRLWPPGRRRAISRGSVYSRSKKRVRVGSERRSSLARPSGQRGRLESEAGAVPPWLGLPVGEAGWSRRRAGQAFQSERRAGVGSERRSSLARPSGQRGGLELEASQDRPSGLV